MPNKPMKICNHPGCTNFIYGNNKYCSIHKKLHIDDSKIYNEKYNETRDEIDDIYYSTKWRKLRKWFIDKNPICAECLKNDLIVAAEIVDHIVEVRDGGDFFDIDNLQSLCRHCHNIKTAKEREKRKNINPSCVHY